MSRQIDNMTTYGIEILNLKGMTAPSTASERRRTFIEKHGVTGGTLESRQPAPNKAQHSPPTPQPWSIEATDEWIQTQDGQRNHFLIVDEQDVTIARCYQQPHDTWTAEANAALIVRAVNHADKLAEVSKRLAMFVLQSDFYTEAKDETDNALSEVAAYESEAQ